MNGDVQSVIRGYLERAQVAKTMSDAGRWNEAGDLLRQLMTDVKSCKISASNRDEHDARNVRNINLLKAC